MSTVEVILDKLRELPRTEVDNVRKRINAFLSLGAWSSDGQEMIDAEESSAAKRVYDIIMREMQAAGLIEARLPYWRLKNRSSFAEKAERLVGFLRQQHKERRVQDGILNIGVQLLLDHFRHFVSADPFDQDSGMSVNMICRNIGSIPARLDKEFPGYGGAGLLHLLVRPGS